jgi:hypothetical protein
MRVHPFVFYYEGWIPRPPDFERVMPARHMVVDEIVWRVLSNLSRYPGRTPVTLP